MAQTSAPSLSSNDGSWDLNRALDYANGKNSTAAGLGRNPVIADTYKYYCFSDSDKTHPDAVNERVRNEPHEVNARRGNIFDHKSAVEVYIGEYSCALDGQTWSHVDDTERGWRTAAFGQVQTRRWTSNTCGTAFWTFSMDWMDGGDWGFQEQVNTGSIAPPTWSSLSSDDVRGLLSQAEVQRWPRRDQEFAQHVGYWKSVAPEAWAHDGYVRGWELGFTDAVWFFGAGINGVVPGGRGGGMKVGALDLWTGKRMIETGEVENGLGWEWEHGFRRGVNDFYEVVGI